jgi:AraC-like DNA-binding protein
MEDYKISIKNMVCPRCIMAVETVLNDHSIKYKEVILGEITLYKEIEEEEKKKISDDLEKLGFEVLSDKKTQTIERIKTIIIETIHHDDELEHFGNISEYISRALGHNYSSLSKLFSDVEGITIEKYMINQKIEKAKELLIYGELNINEIAISLGYSSSQHLSTQFKTITGLSPSEFKKDRSHSRKPLTGV